MNPLESEDVNLNDLLEYYFERADKDLKNMNRVRRFYKNKEEFNQLMLKIIEKDLKRFERLSDKDLIPNPWRIFYAVLEIVLEEGEDIPPYDTLTNMFPSKNVKYMDWTFSWVHGENTLVTVFNPDDELVYRF